MKKYSTARMALSAMFLALGLVLPFLTGQVPEIGSRLLPMHLPALLCGFICGFRWGLPVGLLLPLVRSLLFGAPPMPNAVPMAFELAAYGAVAGFLYERLAGRPARSIVSLVVAMLVGRVVWGLASLILYRFISGSFTLAIFWTAGFINAVPGILLQLVLIPALLLALERARLIPLKN